MAKIKPHPDPCPRCNGRGKVPRVHGADLRAAREKAGLAIRELARQSRFSASFLSDVELGRRNPSPAVVAVYEALP